MLHDKKCKAALLDIYDEITIIYFPLTTIYFYFPTDSGCWESWFC